MQVCTKQQYQRSFPTRTQKRTRGAQMAPRILSQASHSALRRLRAGYAQATRRLLQLPASANDHGCEALQSWHSDRCCFTRSCTHETRSLQFEVCKLGRSDNHCTVRLSKALSQKASSSLEAPLHQVPQTEVKAITIRLDIHKHMQRAQEKIARICIGCWKTWKT